jgi:hypothetical protein
MFKSKHSGWTWELKRTPFGGGGGGGFDITNPIDWSGGGDALASIDPGPAIGSGLASADKFMTNLTPYGWALPAALVAAYFTGGGSLAAEGAAEAGTAAAGEAAATSAATEAGSAAYSSAIASGATEAEATAAANAAADSALASSTGAQAGTGLEALGSTSTPGADAVLATPDVAPSVAPASSGSFGSITAPATGSGAIPGAGATTLGGGGLTGALPAGVVVGDGTLGTTMGATYMATDSGGIATDLLGNPIPASSTGIGGFAPSSGLSASDIASNANRLKNIAKLLTGSSGSGITGMSAPTAQQWSTQAGLNAAQATPQQFGGLYQMNKNPFTFQNPLANALKGKDTTGLDVSGTPGTALNTQQQNQIYSSLLRSA